jgi:uncharacterized protein YecE (DUF72 family)
MTRSPDCVHKPKIPCSVRSLHELYSRRSNPADGCFTLIHMHVIRIGCAGWNIPAMHAQHFPTEGSHLQRYSSLLNCAEINSCFYCEHKPETYARWAATVPADFRFAVKAPRAITHEGELRSTTRALLQCFLEQTAALGEKRGPVLLQIPPSLQFIPDHTADFFRALRDIYDGSAVFEPRHASWFADQAEMLLREFRIARVAADPAIVPGAAEPGGWPEPVYYRLHGSPRKYYSSYTDEFLSTLAAKLVQASANADTWCLFDNTASGAAIANALALKLRVQ